MLRRIFTSWILLCFVVGQLTSAFAVGSHPEIVNSLDDLPFGNINTPVPAPTLPKEKIHFSREVPEKDIEVLLSEKRAFEAATNISTPWVVDPFSDLFLGQQIISSEQEVEIPETGDFLGSLGQKGKILKTERESRKSQKISTMQGTVGIKILSGTTIKTPAGDIIQSSDITVNSLDTTKKQLATRKYEKSIKNKGNAKKGFLKTSIEGFEFGIPGKHLIFSQPVEITLDAPHMSDGNAVDLLTFHAGDTDFNTLGLSTRSDTLCNADGSASLPGSVAKVVKGKIRFYTCGASSFTMNPSGGIVGSNDLRIIIGDCGQAQIYYYNQRQIYNTDPPGTGCSAGSTMDAWPAMRIGTNTYGNDFALWTTSSTTGSTDNNTYTAKSVMVVLTGGLAYTGTINWSYTAPNKFLTWDYKIEIPTGNTQNVRFYYGMDSTVGGADAGDIGYYTLTGGQTIGIYDTGANILSGFRHISGTPWTGYQANGWNTVRGQIANGQNFTNTVQTTGGDLGFGINWDFGASSGGVYTGAVEWRMTPFVSGSLADVVPGIGQPEGPLVTNLASQVPITITNVGTLASTGTLNILFQFPTYIVGPASPFTSNGWSCGAQVGTGVTCTKDIAIPENLGMETFYVLVTPDNTASGASATFYARLTNSSDTNTGNNLATTVNAVVRAPPASDAGGVGGENLWLQANNSKTSCTTNGCTLTGWTNIGGLGATANATTGIGTPTFDSTNTINFNPTVYMNGAGMNLSNGLSVNATQVSIFAVTRIGTGGSFLVGPQGAPNGSALEWMTSPTTEKLSKYAGTSFYNGANSRKAGIPQISTVLRNTIATLTGYVNGKSVYSSTTAGAFTARQLGIGRDLNTGSTLTNLAEILIYPSTIALSASQKNQIESYLAVKYGITLDQTTPTDYVFANGVSAWQAGAAGEYKNDIAGVVRDDISTLNQTKSQSVNNTGDIIVERINILNNRLSLMWSNNGSGTTAFTGTDAQIGFERIEREWLFQERNGDMGAVSVYYPSSSVPSGFTGTLMLLTDSDGLFSSGVTAYTGTYNSGTSQWSFSLNIANMQYVTFAKSIPIDTTAPVITSNSIASGTLAPIGTFPITLTYADTGSLVNTGSLTGAIYVWNSTGATWGTGNIASSYLSVTSRLANTGTFQLTGLPYGKYRFDFSLKDIYGNTSTGSYTYYVDALEWSISDPIYSIGDIPFGATTFGTGEVTVTVKTVGAGFDVTMIKFSDMTYLSDTLPVYSGSTGWGYDSNTGSGYSGSLTGHSTTQTLISRGKNIDPDGKKNTFTYTVKYGVNPSALTPAGNYTGNVSFGLALSY